MDGFTYQSLVKFILCLRQGIGGGFVIIPF